MKEGQISHSLAAGVLSVNGSRVGRGGRSSKKSLKANRLASRLARASLSTINQTAKANRNSYPERTVTSTYVYLGTYVLTLFVTLRIGLGYCFEFESNEMNLPRTNLI